MVRAIGICLFLLGLLGILAVAGAPDPVGRFAGFGGGGFTGSLVLSGFLLWYLGGTRPRSRRRQYLDEYDDRPRSRRDGIPVARKVGRSDEFVELTPAGGTVGACRTCGYRPVAFNADYCPECGTRNPNPGVVTRYVGRALLGGLFVGGLVGAVWGFFGLADGGPAGALGGLLLGALPGMAVGLVAGVVAGLIARLSGSR